MLWGLFQTLFNGLNIDLRVWRETSAESVRTGYTGYSGSIDFVKPQLIEDLSGLFSNINNKLEMSSSAIVTLLLLVMICMSGNLYLLWKLKKVKTNTVIARGDVEEANSKVSKLGGQMAELFAARKRQNLMEATRKMLTGFNNRQQPDTGADTNIGPAAVFIGATGAPVLDEDRGPFNHSVILPTDRSEF